MTRLRTLSIVLEEELKRPWLCWAWQFSFLHFLTSLIKFILGLKFFYRWNVGARHGGGHSGVGGTVPAPGRPHRVLLSYTSSEKETEVAGGKHAVVDLMGCGGHTKPACPNRSFFCVKPLHFGASLVVHMVKSSSAMQEVWAQSWVGKIPWSDHPNPVSLPEKSHGQRSLAGYSPWGFARIRHDLTTKQINTWVGTMCQASC